MERGQHPALHTLWFNWSVARRAVKVAAIAELDSLKTFGNAVHLYVPRILIRRRNQGYAIGCLTIDAVQIATVCFRIVCHARCDSLHSGSALPGTRRTPFCRYSFELQESSTACVTSCRRATWPTQATGEHSLSKDPNRGAAVMKSSSVVLFPQQPALQLIYDAAPIGLACLSPDCRYLQINQRLTEICGISVEDHLGRSVIVFESPISPDEALRTSSRRSFTCPEWLHFQRRLLRQFEPAQMRAFLLRAH
jgi:PAS domain-containing protein